MGLVVVPVLCCPMMIAEGNGVSRATRNPSCDALDQWCSLAFAEDPEFNPLRRATCGGSKTCNHHDETLPEPPNTKPYPIVKDNKF